MRPAPKFGTSPSSPASTWSSPRIAGEVSRSSSSPGSGGCSEKCWAAAT